MWDKGGILAIPVGTLGTTWAWKRAAPQCGEGLDWERIEPIRPALAMAYGLAAPLAQGGALAAEGRQPRYALSVSHLLAKLPRGQAQRDLAYVLMSSRTLAPRARPVHANGKTCVVESEFNCGIGEPTLTQRR